MWTGKFLKPERKRCGFQNIRIRACGRGLKRKERFCWPGTCTLDGSTRAWGQGWMALGWMQSIFQLQIQNVISWAFLISWQAQNLETSEVWRTVMETLLYRALYDCYNFAHLCPLSVKLWLSWKIPCVILQQLTIKSGFSNKIFNLFPFSQF